MNRKAVAVRVNGGTAYCEFSDNLPVRADIFYDSDRNILGNIYVGYVKDIVKNINCAFVEYEPGERAYLQLSQRTRPVFLNAKNTEKLCEGDRIIVQLIKDAMGTKEPVCTTEFELAGRYVVLTHGLSSVSFSKKIADAEYKSSMKERIGRLTETRGPADFGILLRTKAYGADVESVEAEAVALMEEYDKLIETAKTRAKNFLLREAERPLSRIMRELDFGEGDRIVTDNEEIIRELKGLDLKVEPELYTDKLLPLYKLCSLEKVFSDASDRKVWLKSGGYIIIDYTEAMTVIDVNTGKCTGGRDREKTFLKINMEAAAEIARQLSLRNISGIIIVDFIDMAENESRQQLLAATKKYAAEDKINTNVVDFTKLNLMEITRKKTRDRIRVREGLFEAR